MYHAYVIGKNDKFQFGLNHKENCQLTNWSIANKQISVNKINQTTNGMIVTDNNDNIYSMGSNEHGQCAINNKKENVKKPEKILFFKNNNIKIQQIFTTGPGYSVFFKTMSNAIYGCGVNGTHQLGIGNSINKKICEPIFIESLGTNIRKICGAFLYSLALTNNGTVLSTTGGEYGGNGHNNGDKNNKSFTIIKSLCNSNINIIDISVGSDHSLFLSNAGKVFSVGYNKYGQCGCGIGNNTTANKITEICEIETFTNNNVKIKIITSGYAHNLLIDNNNKCWSFGRNTYGQCGNNTTNNIHTPQIISSLIKDESVSEVKCGYNHSMVKINGKKEKKYFLFGQNDKNQCVTNDGKGKILIPNEINNKISKITNKKIKSIHLGWSTTTIIVCDVIEEKYENDMKEN
eukprot:141339_1